jgi:ABC-type antimicrobial peptide transport system permease subunit
MRRLRGAATQSILRDCVLVRQSCQTSAVGHDKHFRDSAPEFEQLAAFQAGHNSMTVRGSSGSARTEGIEFVSGNYFTTFGIGAYAGRTLIPADDVPGAPPAVVLSYQVWQTDYAADPGIVGSTLYMQSRPVTVVGIAAPKFYADRVDTDPPQIWVPLAVEPVLTAENSILKQADSNWLYTIGRLKPGVSPVALQAKLSAGLRQWLSTQDTYTKNGSNTIIPKQHVVLAPAGAGVQNMQQNAGTGLKLLMAISGLVLLVACANVANLMLARAATRRAEISVRMALGAARARLIRQMLTESVALGCIG